MKRMVTEKATLEVNPSQTDEFEAAFAEAILLLDASPGSHNARLERCIEIPSRYQLVVEWDSLESHTEVFRNSALYEKFRDLLIHFYVEKPAVSHYEFVLRAP
jgi:heme-degrading monooxygenase HmoA